MNPAKASLDLIHYGTDKFDREKIEPIIDRQWTKPQGGLWACPVDSTHSWRDWCLMNEFQLHRLKKHVRLRFEGKVLTINNPDDLELLEWVTLPDSPLFLGINFSKALKAGIDAIHLTAKGERATRWSRPKGLYGWDCESVLVMNPKCLTEVVPDAKPHWKGMPPHVLVIGGEHAKFVEDEWGWKEGVQFVRPMPLPVE